MFLTSGTSYYIVALSGSYIHCKSGLVIPSPQVKIKLLTYSDLYKINLMEQSKISLEDIYEEICNKCILGIQHFEEEEIDYVSSPAGIVGHIGQNILHHSRDVFFDLPKTFEAFSNSVTLIDQIHAFVSRYTCTPIKEVREMPIDQLLKDFSIIQSSFPQEIQPIQAPEDEISKVGG